MKKMLYCIVNVLKDVSNAVFKIEPFLRPVRLKEGYLI